MRNVKAGGIILGLGGLLAATMPAVAQDSLPPGVTPQMIADGQRLYRSVGLCLACHGMDGKGMKGLGANLTDAEWLHSKGTYEDIVQQITKGVTADQSSTKVVMPPRGGARINDEQVKAIAAYVWKLSHGGVGR